MREINRICTALIFFGYAMGSALYAESPTLIDFEGVTKSIDIRDEDGIELNVIEGEDVPYSSVLKTGVDQSLSLAFTTGMTVVLAERTEVRVLEDKENGVPYLDLVYGKLRSFLVEEPEDDLADARKLFIKTRTAVIGVRGTDFVLDFSPSAAQLYVIEGQVAVGERLKDFADGSTLTLAGEEKVNLSAPRRSWLKEKFKKKSFLGSFSAAHPHARILSARGADRFKRFKKEMTDRSNSLSTDRLSRPNKNLRRERGNRPRQPRR